VPSLDPERPIFVLAAGWRTGSTLVQRLLCSHPGVMVWGESRGLVAALREASATLEGLEPLAAKGRAHLERDGHQGWIALATPPLARFREGARELLLAWLARPAAERGRPRWGFKEVRYDAGAARWLGQLFPGARFVLLVRHPEACLASARGTTHRGVGLLPEVGGAGPFVDHWIRTARSFVEEAADLPALLLRYEDLVAEPEATTRTLAGFLDLDAATFDPEVFAQPVRGWTRTPRLEAADRRLLRRRDLWEVAGRLGYAPERARPAAWRWLRRGPSALPDGAPIGPAPRPR
jgi:hypothetical protein